MPQAYFRTDASAAIGSGHVMRCLTLADALADAGWRCTFLSSEDSARAVPALSAGRHDILPADHKLEAADILIVDHYGLDAGYEGAARSWAERILVIDDLADRKHDCDVLVDMTYGRDAADYQRLVPEFCSILTGADYALLRPQFLDARGQALERRAAANSVQRILVSLGSTNIHNITGRVIDLLSGYRDQVFDVDVIIGSRAPHLDDVKRSIESSPHHIDLKTDVSDMAALMAGADLAIGAGGTTSWERCCLGLPSLAVVIADNQEKIAAELAAAGALLNLGWHESLDEESFVNALKELCNAPEKLASMSAKAAAICDGRGADRFLTVLASCNDTNIHLRPLELCDAEQLFAWQNDPQTRKYFRNPQRPSIEEHFDWVRSSLTNKDRKVFVIESDSKSAGIIRLDKEKKSGDCLAYEVSILTAPEFYGQGIAKKALKNICSFYSGVELRAEIMPENEASIRLFSSLGFVHEKDTWYTLKS